MPPAQEIANGTILVGMNQGSEYSLSTAITMTSTRLDADLRESVGALRCVDIATQTIAAMARRSQRNAADAQQMPRQRTRNVSAW